MEQALVIREYEDRDGKGVSLLKKATYGVAWDEQEWHWKFESGSVRPAKIYVADREGMIVGLRIFLIHELKVMSELFMCGYGVDIMVHPNFRRYGIAATMAQEGFIRMEQEGVPILRAFPNETLFKVYSRKPPTYWKHVCSIPLLAKPIDIDSILKNRLKNSLLRGLARLPMKAIFKVLSRDRLHKADDLLIKRIYSFDSRFDSLWKEASQGYNIGLVRDEKFLNWRFTDKPAEDYFIFSAEKRGNVLGYIILKNAELFNLSLGLVVDMLAIRQDDIIDSLIAKAIEHFHDQKVGVVGCLMLKHSPYFKALRRAGFIAVPKALSPKKFYFGVQVKPGVLSDKVVNNPVNWFLTFGDLDIA